MHVGCQCICSCINRLARFDRATLSPGVEGAFEIPPFLVLIYLGRYKGESFWIVSVPGVSRDGNEGGSL